MNTEEIRQAAQQYLIMPNAYSADKDIRQVVAECFADGAEWVIRKFEEERLKACEKQTEKEARREQQFVMDFLKENSRTPTFSDCIEITRRQMIETAAEWLMRHDAISEDFSKTFRKAMER